MLFYLVCFSKKITVGLSLLESSGVIDRPFEGTGNRTPSRRETTILRVVRDTRQARAVKQLYNYRCQVCNIVLEGSAGPYAEAAHIKPLGSPHNGFLQILSALTKAQIFSIPLSLQIFGL